jgi:phosphatidylethanolamine/phosphatidyl-N-methylethanolamine N-methyltransferase
MVEKNEKTKIKYRWLSSIYDLTAGSFLFSRIRRREFELMQIQPKQRILLVGIGTGLDIPFIPSYAEVVGIDMSIEMLSQARIKSLGRNISLYEMNAEKLNFEKGSFDIVVLNLILSVVGNPYQTMREVFRVLKPTGSIWIVGKFIKTKVSPLRKVVSYITQAIGGANLNLSLHDLIKDLPLIISHEETHAMADIIQLKPNLNS